MICSARLDAQKSGAFTRKAPDFWKSVFGLLFVTLFAPARQRRYCSGVRSISLEAEVLSRLAL
jgi:hypothetical protein